MTDDTTDLATRARAPHSHPPLWRHYVEMVLAMLVGMLLLGGLRDLVGLTVSSAESAGASYLLMATDMALGMAAWMRVRGHSWSHTLEMCAVMYVPVVLLPLVWLGIAGSTAFMIAAHVVMMVLMLVVLLRQHGGTTDERMS